MDLFWTPEAIQARELVAHRNCIPVYDVAGNLVRVLSPAARGQAVAASWGVGRAWSGLAIHNPQTQVRLESVEVSVAVQEA